MFFVAARRPETNRTVGRSIQAIILMSITSLLLVGGLGARLGYLQLVEGRQNFRKAQDNRIRLIAKPPERGRIYDRNGKLLASSRVSYSVFVWPSRTKETAEWAAKRKRLAQILNIPEKKIQTQVDKSGSDPYRVRIARSIGVQEVIALEEARLELGGIDVDAETVRAYPNGPLAAHVLGYTGEVTDELLDKLNAKLPEAPKDEVKLEEWRSRHYRLGDVVGQAGVEQAFESELRGGWGGQQVEVDAAGQVLRVVGEKTSPQGNDLHLTLDVELQKAAESVLGTHQGAIVALDPRNGGVLAMVSRPGYDPNVFSKPLSESVWQQLNRPDAPLVNRALRAFPPASTFKIVTTVAAIESGKFPPNTVLQTFPYLTVGGIQFWDWNRAGFGPLGFTGAMAFSSDTFFYQVARTMPDGEPLRAWTKRFGFGEHTGIELKAEEDEGLVPTSAWKQEYMGSPWFVGDTVNMSIGQGFMLSTPLQVAVMFAVPASGGDRIQPHLRKDNETARSWRKSLNLKPETIRILQQGLREVITIGTAGGAMNTGTLPPNAGKTGTAEDPPRESHSWYGGYAPLDEPEILIVAFGENSGGGGGKFAAPMVRRVMEAYFRLKAGKPALEPLPGPPTAPTDNPGLSAQ